MDDAKDSKLGAADSATLDLLPHVILACRRMGKKSPTRLEVRINDWAISALEIVGPFIYLRTYLERNLSCPATWDRNGYLLWLCDTSSKAWELLDTIWLVERLTFRCLFPLTMRKRRLCPWKRQRNPITNARKLTQLRGKT